ncbi:testis-expressed protein 47 isoform X5 [Onychostoma macrolepis]|uniref:testis-expressed protein 47 isoform X5 n=1 Tax=Onychostoma macrolepis TaxID=369639 RepID=UPI00272BEC02|nr:testis-expressed protein 47 isoform X5 [Onychostoma macrolepis]
MELVNSEGGLVTVRQKSSSMEKHTQSCSAAGDDESSLFHRRLMQRRHKHSDSELKFLLHRLTVIGRLSCEAADRRTVGDHLERLMVSLQRRSAGEDVTGLLLIYPRHTLLVIECSTEALLSVLQDLRHMEENSGPILEPRVLLVSHDLPSRLFQRWNYKLLDESDSQRTLVSDEQSPEKLLSDTLHQILRLGHHLFNKTHLITGSKVIPDEVLKDASDAVPPQAAVSRLLQMEALLSPARYISTYHSPLHQRLDSGHVFGSFRPTTV